MAENQLVQLNMDEFTTALKNALGDITKQLGMDQIDRKHGMFPGAEVEDEKKTKDARLKSWLRSVVRPNLYPDDVAATKAVVHWATTVGLGFAPEEFRTEVIRVAADYGWARKFGYVFPTTMPKINLNQANGLSTAYWITDQITSITEADPTFTEPTISIAQCACITSVANALLADATFPVIGYLAGLFGEAIAYAEDYQAGIGTGSPFHGLHGTVTSQVAVTAGSGSIKSINGDDLLNLAMGVAAKYRKGGAYFMHPTVLSYLTIAMKNLDGDYILRGPREDGLAATIWGYPVIESEVFPTTDAVSTKVIAFANPKRLFFADRQQLEVAVSQDATLASGGNMFQINSSAVRGIESVGMGWTIGVGTAMLSTAAA